MFIELIWQIIICLILFVVCVYFTRWVYRVNELVELQKQQTRLLEKLLESVRADLITNEIKIKEDKSVYSTNFVEELKFCPACNNSIDNSNEECSDCGLVLKS